MQRKPKLKRGASVVTTLALLTVATLVLASTTLADRTASKPQHVAMEVKSTTSSASGTFVLTPDGAGSLKSDAGTLTFTVSQKKVVRSGQAGFVFTIASTWTGKAGTMVLRARIDDVMGGGGYRVGTGVWSLLGAKGTDQYAGLGGSGRVAYVVTPPGRVLFHYEGLVTKP